MLFRSVSQSRYPDNKEYAKSFKDGGQWCGDVYRTNTYDWENKKINIKFGINDISTIYHKLKNNEDVKLFHDFNEHQKVVEFTAKEGGGYFLGITEIKKSDKTTTKISVPVSAEETSALVALFMFSIPAVHGWL